MRKGSIPRSVARSLPVGTIEPNYAPDGLSAADIDALIAEAFGEVTHDRHRPRWLSADPDERRRARHRVRQITRGLPGRYGAHSATDDGEAA